MYIEVETYSGYKADEYPRKFWLGEKQLEIMDIEDRWYSPGSSYFKVFADDGKTYIIKHNTKSDNWEMVTGGDQLSQ